MQLIYCLPSKIKVQQSFIKVRRLDLMQTSKHMGKCKRELAIFYPTTLIPVGRANNKKRIISGIKLERRRIWESCLEWWRYNRYALDRIPGAAHRDNTGRIALHADLKQILSRPTVNRAGATEKIVTWKLTPAQWPPTHTVNAIFFTPLTLRYSLSITL